VYLIFFLTYTPIDVDHVRGVQGRYFVIVLPVAAVFVATMVDRDLPKAMSTAIGMAQLSPERQPLERCSRRIGKAFPPSKVSHGKVRLLRHGASVVTPRYAGEWTTK
jgi:hypothetical protein